MSKMDISKRRVPQQDRGERRVAEVLEAASAVIAEVGYEAATMTAIAERACASIGALYQYFPNKEAIVRALRQQFGDEMEARWRPLIGQGSKLSVKELVDRIFDVILDFMENRPAYLPLQSAPKNFKRNPAARHRLRGHFAAVFRERRPDMSAEEALRVANVTVQIVKGMNPLYADAKPAERLEIVREFKLVLTSYLSSRLGA
jgi:AcrR family transcriptional regulator